MAAPVTYTSPVRVRYDHTRPWRCKGDLHVQLSHEKHGAQGVMDGQLPCGCARVTGMAVVGALGIPMSSLTILDHNPKNGSNATQPQEEETMTPKSPTLDMAVGAIKTGALMAAATEADKALVDLGTTLLIALGVPAESVASPLVQKAMPFLVPLALHYVAAEYPDMVPQSAAVKQACSYALSGKTFETLAPHMAQIREKVEAVAAVGLQMAKAVDKKAE